MPVYKKEEEKLHVYFEDVQHASICCNMRTICYTMLNPEASFIVCREVLASTGILNIYDIRLDEREVPRANVRF